MRFHVAALPHTNTTKKFIACAYTAKVINFCRMMMDRGHEVFLYGGSKNEAPCTEFIPCVAEHERAAYVGGQHFTSVTFDPKHPFWIKANARMAAEIIGRAQQQDFVCLIGGQAQQTIATVTPHLFAVEFGVGYGGTFAKYRVFESYAWMHMVMGAQSNGNPHAANGSWWDAVIPGYLDPEQFPFAETPEDYFLFVGRVIDRKGYAIAAEVCQKLGRRLIIAGQRDKETPALKGVQYVGVVDPVRRGELMSKATALFVPTLYVEPFANVHVEAMACGTPVITTDWGVFSETVTSGVNGFRCRTFAEFTAAALAAPGLDRAEIREAALSRYSLETVGLQYERYFERLLTMWGKGWYE